MTYVFAVRVLDTEGRNVSGPISNVVSASLQNFGTPEHLETPDVTNDGLSVTYIALIAAGGFMVVTLVTTIVVVLLLKYPAKE